MCDTLVALGNVTAEGVTILGKNSDREPNEAHRLLCIPAARHAPGVPNAGPSVKCTYLEIPQVEQTYAVLLAKPYWTNPDHVYQPGEMLICAIQYACPEEKIGFRYENTILITEDGCEPMSRFPLAMEEI